MDIVPEAQSEELEQLHAIYDEDFVQLKTQSVWKGAAALPEVDIRLRHPESDNVAITLRAKLPRTYPEKAPPMLNVHSPKGLKPEHVKQLNDALKTETRQHQGKAMIFDICAFVQDWIVQNNTLPKKDHAPNLSLAAQLKSRTVEAERNRALQEQQAAARAQEEAARVKAEMDVQIMAREAKKQQENRELRRRRGHSVSTDATGLDSNDFVSFPSEIAIKSIKFDSVRIACRRKEYLWTAHFAEPVYYNQQADIPQLEIYTIVFEAQYYTSPAGKKKMRELEESIRKVIARPHNMLLAYHGVHLIQGSKEAPARLHILAEQRPSSNLHDLLLITGPFNAQKATEVLVQIVSALNVLHAEDIVHRALSAKAVHLEHAPRGSASGAPSAKLSRTAFYSRLCELQHSNPFDHTTPSDDIKIPESWIAREVKHQPLHYTRSRDLWNLGIVLLQMLYGVDVMSRHHSFMDVLDRSDFPQVLRTVAFAMFEPAKKNAWSCMRILEELKTAKFLPQAQAVPMSIPSPRASTTKRSFFGNDGVGSSPEISTSPRTVFHARRTESAPSGRFQREYEIKETLGRGGFGEVLKAENILDGKMYAIKRIRLRPDAEEIDGESKIMREVKTLSRLNHRYIVRYFSAWIEDNEDVPTDSEATESSESQASSADTVHFSSIGKSKGRAFPFSHASFARLSRAGADASGSHIAFADDSGSGSGDQDDEPSSEEEDSFDGERSGEDTVDEDSSEESSFGLQPPVAFNDFPDSWKAQSPAHAKKSKPKPKSKPTPKLPNQTLYIAMEFVENQTLKERIDGGIDEEEAWRLFDQILDALVHLQSLGIIHRDIKLANIFMDEKGDVKVGDFGLATSSVAQSAPSDRAVTSSADPDVTRDVGTRLYVAPEVISRSKKSRNQAKADLYSLGIVFFELNYKFDTGSERVRVIEELRKPSITFPRDWPASRTRQRKIIENLLQHDPDRRMSAVELRHSELLPPRLADEFFLDAMRVMTRPDSTHYLQVVRTILKQPHNPIKASTYNSATDNTVQEQVLNVIAEQLRRIFVKHGAVEMSAPLLGPTDQANLQSDVPTFIDHSGDIVTLPRNLTLPFARLAVRSGQQRIKRYCIGQVYHHVGMGHPASHTTAAFDILTPDSGDGCLAAMAEAIALVGECLNCIPAMSTGYAVDITHPSVAKEVLNACPEDSRSVVEGLLEGGSATEKFSAKKKRDFQKLGLSRAELIVGPWHDRLTLDDLQNNLPEDPRNPELQNAIDEVKKVMVYAKTLGFKQPLYFRTFMNRPSMFARGLCFQVSKGPKRADGLAIGGRYEDLFGSVVPGRTLPGINAIGMQLSMQPFIHALEAHLNQEKRAMQRKSRSSLGSWAPRRADVYVISRAPGHTQERLEVCALLWNNNVRADMMYDHALTADDGDDPLLAAQEDGIFFCIIVPPTISVSGRSEYKVKNLLTGEQHDLSRSEMPTWLSKEVTKQRRDDQKFADSSVASSEAPATTSVADPIEYIMPSEFYSEKKKFLKNNDISLMKVEELEREIRAAMATRAPMVAVDVDPTILTAMTSNSKWLKDEDAWKQVLALFPKYRINYAQHLRNQLCALPGYRKEIAELVLLCSVRDLRVAVLRIPASARTS